MFVGISSSIETMTRLGRRVFQSLISTESGSGKALGMQLGLGIDCRISPLTTRIVSLQLGHSQHREAICLGMFFFLLLMLVLHSNFLTVLPFTGPKGEMGVMGAPGGQGIPGVPGSLGASGTKG